MDSQPKYSEYQPSELFANGRVVQAPVAGTVARDDPAREERSNGEAGASGAAAGARARAIRCVLFALPRSLGTGNGIIVQRGFPRPASLHDERLRSADDQHFIDAMARGYGAMYAFADRVRPRDRWAIVAYIRALQLSQHAQVADVPDAQRADLEKAHDAMAVVIGRRGLGRLRDRLAARSGRNARQLSCRVVCGSAIPIGALGVLLISYLVRGGWTQDFHEPLSRAALTIPVAGSYSLLCSPARLSSIRGPATPRFHLSKPFISIPGFLRCAPLRTSRSGPRSPCGRGRPMAIRPRWSGPARSVSLCGRRLFRSLASTGSSSIEPAFHSSIYGLLILTFTLLAAFAFGLVVVLTQLRSRRMANTAYAAVLLATLMLWAYLHAMQYIIIWAGNIPDEVVWYAVRARGGDAVALWFLFVGQFIVPFFALLSAQVRGSTRALCAIAALTLALRALEAAILIFPPLAVGGLPIALCFPAALVAVGVTLLLAWQMMPRWIERSALRGAAGG